MAAKLTDADRLDFAEDTVRKKNAEIADLKKTITQIRKDNDTAEAIRQEIFGLAAHTTAPPAWISGKSVKGGERGGPITIWSDFHYGEVVDEDQIGGVNKYNKAIAKTRFIGWWTPPSTSRSTIWAGPASRTLASSCASAAT
jgi:hypothetical protein